MFSQLRVSRIDVHAQEKSGYTLFLTSSNVTQVFKRIVRLTLASIPKKFILVGPIEMVRFSMLARCLYGEAKLFPY